ncbi:hypothetical protein CAPTEDRAFT_158459 [Capitella teleta]|uniref:NADH dehydrogenase [ubiquinone] 1 beta subcomplex subunit 10 n=1 Tax=Capitella teleta TaxID=283909 RepID=R7TGN4_CAPTE|nr:hypothetical protein CAPTEDRAFT_158459 [Capitella teleta]|eukprot:ELT92958.1 hypothetical protein CAPTEDRAFT_158459 [Capitella teleta]
MPDGEPNSQSTFEKIFKAYFGLLERPVKFVRENVVEPARLNKENHYYHRRYRRIPGVDECEIGDEICFYEVNKQFKRDKMVDGEVLNILRQRKVECGVYYGEDKKKYCEKEFKDYEEAAANFFQKYGDLGAGGNVIDAYMKQKHRLIWERRHGPVGSGMKATE